MAHKHNRRRVRRSRNAGFDSLGARHPLDLTQHPVVTANIWSVGPHVQNPGALSGMPINHAMQQPTNRRRSDIPVRLWQNRYASWQDRDWAAREHAQKLEAQQIQLFGGEPGDDVELCYRMLEFFGGLDYIK